MEERPRLARSGPSSRVVGGGWGSALIGAADTATFGYLDEIGAGVNSLLLGRDYNEELEFFRSTMDKYEEQHGTMYLTGQIAGGFIPVAGWGGRIKAAATARGLTTGVKGMVIAGGVQGAIYGSGSADGDFSDRFYGALWGGATGAAAGYVLGATIIPGAKFIGGAARDAYLYRFGKPPRLTSSFTPEVPAKAGTEVADDLKAIRMEASGTGRPAQRDINNPSGKPLSLNHLTGKADDVLEEGAILSSKELLGPLSAAREAIKARVGKMTVQQAQRMAERLEKAELDGGVVDDPHYRSLLGIDATDHKLDIDTAKQAATLLEEATEAVLEKAGMGKKTTGQHDHAFREAFGGGVTSTQTAEALERSKHLVNDARIGGHQQMLAALQFTRAKDKFLPRILQGDRAARDELLDELTTAIRIHAEGSLIKAQIGRSLADMRWHNGKLGIAEIRDDVPYIASAAGIRKRIDEALKELDEDTFTDLMSRIKNLDDIDTVQNILLNPSEAKALSGWRRTVNTVSLFIKSNSLTPASGLFNTIGMVTHDWFRNGAARRWAARNFESMGKTDEALALRFEMEMGQRVYKAAHMRGIGAAFDRVKWEWWSDVERIAAVGGGMNSKAKLAASAAKRAMVAKGYSVPETREVKEAGRLAVTDLKGFNARMDELGGSAFGNLMVTLHRTRAVAANVTDALGTATAKVVAGSLDDWGRSFVKMKETYSMAARFAIREALQAGLPLKETLTLAQRRAIQLAEMPPRELLDRVEEQLLNHSDELPADLKFALGLNKEAEREAERVLFMDGPQTKYGRTAAHAAKGLDKVFSLGTVEGMLMTYIRTPIRIFERGMVSYTPWGGKAKEVQDILAKGGMEAEIEKARMEVGSMVMGFGAMLAASGAITLTNGGYDNSANLNGAPPGRLNLPGGAYVEIGRLDPFALTLALGGFVGQAWKAYEDAGETEEHQEALATALQIGFLAAREGILEKTYVTGVRDLMKSVFSEQEEGLVEGYRKAALSAFARAIPLSGTSRTINDTLRGSAPEAIGWMDNVLRSVPGGGLILPARIDPLGNEVEGRSMGVAFGTTGDVDDLTRQLADLQIDITTLKKADPAGFKLNSEELSDLRRIRGTEAVNGNGETMRDALASLFDDPWFQSLPSKEQKEAAVVEVMADFNADARSIYEERNPGYAANRGAYKALHDYMAEGLSRSEATTAARDDVLSQGLPEPAL